MAQKTSKARLVAMLIGIALLIVALLFKRLR